MTWRVASSLRLETLELLAELGDLLLAELEFPLALAGGQSELEGAGFERDQLGDFGLAGARHSSGGKTMLEAPSRSASRRALRARPSSMPLVMMPRLASGCRSMIEADENLPRLDLVSLLDIDLGDGAAFLVLDLLHRAVDDEATGGGHGTGEIDGRRHAPQPENEQDCGQAAGEEVAAQAFAQAGADMFAFANAGNIVMTRFLPTGRGP